MDAFLTEAFDLNYSDDPAILIAASSEGAMRRAERVIEAAGVRVAGRVPIEGAYERIGQSRGAGVWVELDRDAGAAMDELAAAVSRRAAEGRFAAVVSATAELLDPLAARIAGEHVELIIMADDAERIAALATAMARAMPERVSEIGNERTADRLRQLSEEVSRIASTLARLAAGSSAPSLSAILAAPATDSPPIAADTVRQVIRARRLRERYFAKELFADPAWDMLLDLLHAELTHMRVPVSSLCIAAAVPTTTALRWVKAMVGQGLFTRRNDLHDARRVFVELSADSSSALRRYFAEVGAVASV